MNLTIAKLRIGAPLVMGKYSVLRDGEPHPVIWLKGSPNSDFITQYAVDLLSFDSRERNSDNNDFRYAGNPNYKLSNLLSFANSEEEAWYHPLHQYDAPPNRRDSHVDYESHYGFLYYFEDYELESILTDTQEVNGEQVTTRIRLPSFDDVFGADRFKLFNKKGVRPKGTEDLVRSRYSFGYDHGSYFPYWLSDYYERGPYATYISRNSTKDRTYPCSEIGFRPVCTINPDTEVIMDGAGCYHIKPRTIQTNVFTDKELFDFLGMAQP